MNGECDYLKGDTLRPISWTQVSQLQHDKTFIHLDVGQNPVRPVNLKVDGHPLYHMISRFWPIPIWMPEVWFINSSNTTSLWLLRTLGKKQPAQSPNDLNEIIQWIGSREHLQENPIVNGKIYENLWFPVDFPLNQSIELEWDLISDDFSRKKHVIIPALGAFPWARSLPGSGPLFWADRAG